MMRFSTAPRFLAALPMIAALALIASTRVADAAGTLAGTDIDNIANVSFEVGGTLVNQSSNTVTISVDEILDVTVVLQSPQVAVSSPAEDALLLFTVTNTGNGEEIFDLAVINAVAGDDFDPLAASPGLYFDSDDSGDLSPGDIAYVPGSNDPLLQPDQSITLLVANDIPSGLANGALGRSTLTVTARTGSGAPGTVFSGAGTNGVDAVVGSTGAASSVSGEYIVSDVSVAIVKSAQVIDAFGGDAPVPGATIRYTITVEVGGTGTAIGLVVNDPVPPNTSYVAGSLTLNGAALTDAADGDTGSYDDASGNGRVVVQVGDLSAADGVQTIAFTVRID